MVGNHAILQRMHGHHIAGRASQHIPGRRANLQNTAVILIQRHHRGLTDKDTLSIYIDPDIGCAQIHTQII